MGADKAAPSFPRVLETVMRYSESPESKFKCSKSSINLARRIGPGGFTGSAGFIGSIVHMGVTQHVQDLET